MAISYVIGAGVFGLIFGSAINAMVWRLYVGRSWIKGRSECPDCGHKLAGKDLIPVASWLWLHGKCRYCGKRIHWQYPVVELLTAGLFALSAAALEPGVRLGFWLVILVMLVVLAVYDARWLILPDKIMVPLIAVSLVYATTMAVLSHSTQVLLGALAAAALAGGGFLAIVYFSKGRAMGGGDIKLAFAMGLLLGIQGTAVAMLLAFNVAAILGIVMIMTKRRKRHDLIPFGPFLVAGTIIAFLYGRDLVGWYLRINGL